MLGAVLQAGCKSAQTTSQRELGPASGQKPALIYVADFELGAQGVQHQEGRLSTRQGPVGRVGERLSGSSKDPAARARELVDLMSNSLVKELSKAGFNVLRLPPGASSPEQGWLLRGVFVQVQEGNRLQRAMIGLGQGQTDLQVVTVIQDLSQGPPKPLYEIATDASSGNKPGAAPTLVMSPWGAAARFAMAGKDLDRNVKQTAAEIASRIAARFQSGQ